MSHISVPDDEWVINSKKVVKVVLRGAEASTLPPDVFVKALYDNGVLKDNDSRNVKITIPHNNRKRFVYGDVNYEHRQSFSICHNQNNISFLLLDPDDARVQVTLLHMPIETSERAIKYIFNEINTDFTVSDIKVAPGKQMRHDRWQLMIECTDVEEIPHTFVLPNMGPEREHLKIKVFVEGRKAIDDLPQPLSTHDPDQRKDNTEQTNTSLPRSASLGSLIEQPPAVTPANQPLPPTFTPTTRPRPTPSPNENQPFLKRVRPQDKEDATKSDNMQPAKQVVDVQNESDGACSKTSSHEATPGNPLTEHQETNEANSERLAAEREARRRRLRSEEIRAKTQAMKEARLSGRSYYRDDHYDRNGKPFNDHPYFNKRY